MRRLKFNLKIVLLIVAIAAIPSWWMGSIIRQAHLEKRARQRIRRIAPNVRFDTKDIGSSWLSRVGLRPSWLHRVDQVDIPGHTDGKPRGPDDLPVEFTDRDYQAVLSDLQTFNSLEALYLGSTLLTDKSENNLSLMLDELPNVRFWNLQQCQMSSEAVRRIEMKHPEVKIPFITTSRPGNGDEWEVRPRN